MTQDLVVYLVFIVYALGGLAGVAAGRGMFTRAVRLLSMADTLRRAISLAFPPTVQALFAHIGTAAREQLGEQVYLAAWAESATASLPQVIAYALGQDKVGSEE